MQFNILTRNNFFRKIKPIFETLKWFGRSKFSQFWYFCTPRFHFFFQSWMARGNLIFYIPKLLLQNQSHVTTHTLFSTALWLMSRHLNAATWFQKPWSIGAASIGKIEIVKFLCFLFGNERGKNILLCTYKMAQNMV